ncbi:hypothetical protein [Cardinium endosymbiont of Tipula unca]|uniref:hypothetical protein n=1 Tax=Cardinium endosymbiont of Tipula unca TaxID=3066216 RepID=UPI0030CEC3B5
MAITDVFQFLCFGCAFPLIGYLLLRHAKIPLTDGWIYFKQLPQFTDADYIFSFNTLKSNALLAASASLTVLSPLAIQRFYMAKSVQQGQKIVFASVVARAYILGSLFFLAVLLHFGGHVLEPEGNVIGYIIDLAQSPAVRGMIGVMVLALLMSTVDSALHLISIVIVNDLLPPSLFNGQKGEVKKLNISRIISRS